VKDRFAELAGGLNHPEGVAWNPLDGRVYAGGEGGELYAVTLDGEVDELASTGGSMLGVAVDGRGRVYACDAGNGEIVRLEPSSGRVERYGDARGLDTPNALAFGPNGVLYVTCSGEDGEPGVVRIPPGAAAERWTDALTAYPNGCAVTPAGDALVVVESHRPGLSRIPIRPGGEAAEPVSIAALPETDPDGVAFDEAGNCFVTLYRPDGVVRVGADGAVEVVVADPLASVFDAPTNLAFVGASLDRVVVANVGDRFLSIGDLGVRGAPLHHPEVP
jgi:sugar lactone lactonase YvrE